MRVRIFTDYLVESVIHHIRAVALRTVQKFTNGYFHPLSNLIFN
jgi:hypothetical protein